MFLDNFLMSETSIQATGITSDDIAYIRRVSLKTLIQFFTAEIVIFGFGVPIAVIIAIGYGNIADIFMEVYFLPVVITTVFVVLFVAFPTNLYLSRELIKVALNPSLNNVKNFIFSIPRIPLYASINLLFRISIGGLIVDIWGLARVGNVSLETFVALFISPIVGAWTASIIYFFILQYILENYSVKMKDFVFLTGRSELLKIRPLSMKVVYPTFISLTLIMSSLLIASGKLLGATLWGEILIISSAVFVLALLLSMSYIIMRKVVSNIQDILENWKEQKEKFSLYGLYDIEDVIRRLYELNTLSSSVEKELITLLNASQKLPEKIISSSKEIILSLISFKNKLEVKKFTIDIPNYSESRKEISQINVYLSNLLSEFSNLKSELDSLKFIISTVNTDEAINLSLEIKKDYLSVVNELSSLSKFLSGIEQTTSYLINVSKNVIISNIEKIESYSKEIEMIFINFQLEMAKIGYPDEFKFISLQLSKILSRISELSKNLRSITFEFENSIKKLYDDIKKVFVSYDSEYLLLSGFGEKITKSSESVVEINNSIQKANSFVKEIKSFEKLNFQELQNFTNNITAIFSRLTLTGKIVEERILLLNKKISEIQDILNRGIEKAKTFKKVLEVSKKQ